MNNIAPAILDIEDLKYGYFLCLTVGLAVDKSNRVVDILKSYKIIRVAKSCIELECSETLENVILHRKNIKNIFKSPRHNLYFGIRTRKP